MLFLAKLLLISSLINLSLQKSADSKARYIMKQCYKSTTPYGWYSLLREAELFFEDQNLTFDTQSDEMPYQGIAGSEKRPKLIHSVGMITETEFISNKKHKYTGSLKGTKNMILRFSLAKKPQYNPPSIVPGISMKFLRTNKPSGNVMAMYSLEGQKSFNPFEHDMTNHAPTINPDTADSQLLLLQKKFKQASDWPGFIGLRDLCTYDEDGNKEKNINFPFRLVFHPSKKAHRAFPSKVIKSEDYYVKLLKNWKINDVLYYVYAQESPSNEDLTPIGEIRMKTPFTASEYGDRTLFFQHKRFEDDLLLKPEWEKDAKQIVEMESRISYYVHEDLPFNI